MASRPPPPESGPKEGESVSDEPPLDRFSRLAKGLFGVSRPEFEEVERREREAKKTARVAPRGPRPKPS
jgi:hypothetical protein